jgi:spore germination protein KA
MNTIQSTALMDRVSEILASLGDSSDVKSRYHQLTGGHSSACLLYIDGIVDTASIQEHIIEPLLHQPALEEDEFFIPYLIHSVFVQISMSIHRTQIHKNTRNCLN